MPAFRNRLVLAALPLTALAAACHSPQTFKPVAARETMEQAGAYHGDHTLAYRALNILHAGRFAEDPAVGPLRASMPGPAVTLFEVYVAIDHTAPVAEGQANTIERGNETLAGWVRTETRTNGLKQSIIYNADWEPLGFLDDAGVLNVGGVLPFGNATLALNEACKHVFDVRGYVGVESYTYDTGTVLASRVAAAKLAMDPQVKRPAEGSAVARGVSVQERPRVIYVRPLPVDRMASVIARHAKAEADKLEELRAASLREKRARELPAEAK